MKIMASFFALSVFLSACFEREENKISYEKYKEQGELMIKITEKLSNEPDANRLNTAARGVQLARVVACQTLFDECDKYGHFLSEAIELSADGKLSYEDVTEIKALHKSLKYEIQRGYASFEKK